MPKLKQQFQSVNDRPPNFRNDRGEMFLVRCFECNKDFGRENWAPAVASGECAWCGWNDEKDKESK